jgi:mRNA interferase MazF
MRCGEVSTVSAGKYHAAKPRPAVIVQDNSFDATDSHDCAFTTDPTDTPLFRLVVEPNERSGLCSVCRIMVDKITTLPRAKVGAQVGRLDDEDMARLNQAMTVFLSMAASPRTSRGKEP